MRLIGGGLPSAERCEDFGAEGLRSKHDFSYEVFHTAEPNWREPEGELAWILRRNAHEVTGISPVNVIGMGTNDARLWRYHDMPAVVYGPAPTGMASVNENVLIEEALNVLKVHLLSSYDYLAIS